MNNHGNLHRIMLFVILFAGFGLGLGLPALHRHTDERNAREALHTAQTLVRSEHAFYEKNGFYTADFGSLFQLEKCEQTVENEESVLACPGYTISLKEAQVLHVQSTKYPQWFNVPLEGGKTVCEYEDGSLVGPRLCAAAHL